MNTGYNKSLAIVIDTIDYGESDRIITFYTPGDGKLKGVAKGARRSRRRFVNSLDPFSLGEIIFFYKEGRDLVRIDDSKPRYHFGGIKGDIGRLPYGSYMLEFVREMTRERQANGRIFNLLLRFLRMLEDGEQPDKVIVCFNMRLFAALGYLPSLGKCVLCSGIPDREMYSFSSRDGGIICGSCGEKRPGGCISISGGTVKFLMASSRMELDKIGRLVPSPSILEEGNRVLRDFLRYQLGKELRTVRFIDEIGGLTPP